LASPRPPGKRTRLLALGRADEAPLCLRVAFTADEVAAAKHAAGRERAKVTVVKAGNRFVMAVLPAPICAATSRTPCVSPERWLHRRNVHGFDRTSGDSGRLELPEGPSRVN
jgi:hypothetical protein